MFWRKRKFGDFAEEVETHLKNETDQLVAEGLSRRDAETEARRAFGNITTAQERFYESTRARWLDQLRQDLRYAVRALRNSPAFSIAAILTLALGIGANAAVFNVVNAVLLRLLPVQRPQELVQLGYHDQHDWNQTFSYPAYEMFRDSGVFAGAFAFGSTGKLNAAYHGNAELTSGMIASGTTYQVLGVQPAIGRLLNPEDDRIEQGSPVVVLSYGYWERRFGGDPRVIGETLVLNGQAFTIIGVTSPRFQGITFDNAPDVTVPVMMTSAVTDGQAKLGNASWWLRIVARRKPGVPDSQAIAALAGTFQRSIELLLSSAPAGLAPDLKSFLSAMRFDLKPAANGAFSNTQKNLSTPLLVLMMMVALLLVIACANLAHLLFARGMGRQREIGIRLALGASRSRLVRQLLTENFLLATLGGGCGLLLATQIGPSLMRRLTDQATARFLSVDWGVIGFTVGISVASTLLFGLAPAWRASRFGTSPISVNTAPGGRVTAHNSRSSILLIAGQVALSVVLLAGAGLFARTLYNLRTVDPGFRPQHLLAFSVSPQLAGYRDRRLLRFYQDVLARLESIPGVQLATVCRGTPGTLDWRWLIEVAGLDGLPQRDREVGRNLAGPRFVETTGMTLELGRDFGPQDHEGTPLVAVVNRTFARRYFGDENPIGKQFNLAGKKTRQYRIIGVVRDARDRGLRSEPARMVYSSYLQEPVFGSMTFLMRTTSESGETMPRVRSELHALDRAVPVFEARTVTAELDSSLSRERLLAILSICFGLLAALLTSVGLYGTIAYTVSRQTKEIGIRMALGATARGVLWPLLARALRMIGLGVVIGIPLAIAAARSARSLLFGLAPHDPLTLTGAVATLLAVAALAAWIPSRRATRLDPLIALRHD